ncbi:RagB/SusD family nutrient uptake outer membrane protein [Sphingobacterium sp. DN00404]|uniref:RagB/SusD family nutrient uptake outer membrane protein n=1 Tax=Sphingobacterium micropteri TaxID=2763501 RepID=A0ABR7YNQ8_9SPHI|nr:RagB/SusD family nutrient uptake outer membrane protein [Sphingobacterium micropteri]MBD1432969.1 RagB/SusD family nutrient uptake outer membrane protein [Sphingobacterium micropteri]
MKTLKISSLMLGLMLTVSSCSKFLEEQPRSSLTPDFFTTEQGIIAGLTAAYSGLRYQYGTQGGMSISSVGTDEATKGGDGNEEQINNYGVDILGAGHFQTPWNRNFTFINTCNGIVDYATGDNEALVAEAKFLRAQYYYGLVTMFGGVPLDLGSGPLKFTTTPTTTSVRNTAIEVFEAIVEDLKGAIEGLPAISTTPGRVGKAAAIHYLAKTYLAIACYYDYDYTNEINNDYNSTASVEGVNSAKAREFYQLALTTAKQILDNRGTYGVGLLADFADVNRAGNEHSIESLFTVERTTDYIFDESGAGASGGPEDGLKENRANFMFCAYYEGPDGDGTLLARTREYGRGWRRFVPTKYLIETVFADKVNDSRYYKSFQSLWSVNRVNDGVNHPDFGKPAIFMPGVASYAAAAPEIQQVIDKMQVEGSATAKQLIRYNGSFTRNMFPSSLKLADPNGEINDSSHRPFIVSKLSETILVAVEAAFKIGDNATAVAYINELRTRAAKGSVLNTHIPGLVNETQAIANMQISAGSLTLDFILDERSRELCCEQLRWFDLIRTNKLIPRLQAGYNAFGIADDTNFSGAAAANVRRFHHLRPIPQQQMDAMTGDNKAAYQNPGY